MNNRLSLTVLFCLLVVCGTAQVGINTTTPHSSFHIKGSVAINYRPFTTDATINATDNFLVFTGNSASTLSLPTAVAVKGRQYSIKNASGSSVTPVLTVQPYAAETIEGLTAWTLDETGKAVTLISNGINWQVLTINLPGWSSVASWSQTGNSITATKSLGTMSNYDLPFSTNNTEKMRLTTNGSLGIGTAVFDASNPEKLLVDAGTTASVNVISGKGTNNSYLQLNIQNKSAANLASSDIVASSNNATDSSNFIDFGINSSTFNNTALPILDGPNSSYLYTTGNDFIIGNGNTNKDLLLFSGGVANANETVRVTGAGFTGVGTTVPTEKLQVEGNMRLSGLARSIFFDAYVDPYSGIKNFGRSGEVNELMVFSGNDVVGTYGPDRIRLASSELYFATAPTSAGINTGDVSSFYQNTATTPTRMFINKDGNVAMGTTTFNSTQPEELLVDAGATTSNNVVSAKGNLNSYLQLNIQNNSGGDSASADIVATADNGNERANFVDMGINSDAYAGTGPLSGPNTAYLYTTGNHFIIGNNTDNKSLIFYTSTAGVGTQRMRITNAGLLPGQDNKYQLGSSSNRLSAIWAANGTIQTSDRRLKKNIMGLEYGLTEVLQLRPVFYNWIDTINTDRKIGLIAQEVKKIIPEVVLGDASKETLGMNYAELMPVLVNALKELQEKQIRLKKKAAAMHLLD